MIDRPFGGSSRERRDRRAFRSRSGDPAAPMRPWPHTPLPRVGWRPACGTHGRPGGPARAVVPWRPLAGSRATGRSGASARRGRPPGARARPPGGGLPRSRSPIPAHRSYYVRAYPAYAAELGPDSSRTVSRCPRAPRVVISCSETLTARARGGYRPCVWRPRREPLLELGGAAPRTDLSRQPGGTPREPGAGGLSGWRARTARRPARVSPGGPSDRAIQLCPAVRELRHRGLGRDGGSLPVRPRLADPDWARRAHERGHPDAVRPHRVGDSPEPAPLAGSRTAELWEYQAEQTAPDDVVLRVVPAPRFTASTVAALRAEIQECLGADVTLRVDVVGRIAPEPSGKRPVIVSRARSRGCIAGSFPSSRFRRASG